MVYHLPILPADLDLPKEGWAPKETFSPSQLTTFGTDDGCQRKWAWGSCFGVWGARKSLSTLFGSLIHGSIEHYLNGGTFYDLIGPKDEIRIDERTWSEFQTQIDRGFITKERIAELAKEAPLRALAGQNYLPNIHDTSIQKLEVERWINIDTTRIIGGVEKLRIPGKVDLTMLRAGVWYLFDHKSTKGRPRDPWAYCKTPEQLYKDPQAVFYALDLMLRHGLEALWIRWTYFLTDPKAHPLAHAVDVELKREAVFAAAFDWLVKANQMREYVRGARAGTLTPDDVPANPKACDGFGGCSYSYTKGGPCVPSGQVKLSDMILPGNKPAKEPKEKQMTDLAAKLASARGLIPGAVAPVIPPNPLVPPEAHVVAPAPVLPAALPAGWHWHNQAPRQDAPAGYQYSADGSQFVPVMVAPPPPVIVPPAPVAVVPTLVIPADAGMVPPPLPEVPAAAQATEELPKRKGRPKGVKNKKPTVEGEAGETETDEDDVMERLFVAARDAGESSPLKTLTVAQLKAVADVFEAA